ncbi:kinase [Thraustotheca clavata]|uniref:Kinase n=1 Tax=Thraustotheca clavata TaxID=74557 RepID=A0A1W0A3A0_9STRA|nr:kinase [Thraustotheca clavata]
MGALCSGPCSPVRMKGGEFDEETCNESPNVTPVCEVVVFAMVVEPVQAVRSLTTEPTTTQQDDKKKLNKQTKGQEKVWKDTTLLKIKAKDLVIAGALSNGIYSFVSKAKYNDQLVAVKTIKAAVNTTKLLNHARTLHALQSQYNLQLIGITCNTHKMVFEYMDLGSLSTLLSAKRLKKKQPFKVSSVNVALAIAKGLQDLHNHNIIHGELNSRNVLLSSQGQIKLSDCGFARLTMESNTSSKCTVGSKKKQKHRYVASDCFWTAPENLAGEALSRQSDIYSFGVILSELDTLEMPYASHDISYLQLINEIQTGKRVPNLSASCEIWYHTLAMKCMVFNPQERPSIAEIIRVLEHHN